MPRRNFSRPVKVHHSAAQFDFQFIASDNKLDDVGIFPLVCGRFLGHITTAAHSARGAIYCVADSAISLCRCICWCPTFVLQIATTGNAVFFYAQRGPETKQTSDAIQAKISIRAFFISTAWASRLPLTPVVPPKLGPANFVLGRELQPAGNGCLSGCRFLSRRVAQNDSRSNLACVERRTRSLRLSLARPFRSRQP